MVHSLSSQEKSSLTGQAQLLVHAAEALGPSSCSCGTSLAWVDGLRHVGLRWAHAFLRESTGGLKEQAQDQG